jgi:hypothetical protein
MNKFTKLLTSAVAIERVHSFALKWSPSYKNWYDEAIKKAQKKLKLSRTVTDMIKSHLKTNRTSFNETTGSWKGYRLSLSKWLYEKFSWNYEFYGSNLEEKTIWARE